MTAADLMQIPHPHMLTLKILMDQRKVDPYGAIGWMGAVPEDIKGVIDPSLLFVPLLDRKLVTDCSEQMGEGSGKHFVRITDLGAICFVFGYMTRAAVPVTGEVVDLLQTMGPAPKTEMIAAPVACAYCTNEADGNCENCGAPLCSEHDSAEAEDVMLCKDTAQCAEHIEFAGKVAGKDA